MSASNLSSRRQAYRSVHDISSVLPESAARRMVSLFILNIVILIGPFADWRQIVPALDRVSRRNLRLSVVLLL